MGTRVYAYRVSAVFALAFLLVSGYALRVYATEISGVKIRDVTEDSATVDWKTDIESDATINFGLDERVGLIRYPYFDQKDHTITIDDLDPSTTYHFRVVSTDERGNKSTTAGFVFTTAKSSTNQTDTSKIKDPDQKAKSERIISELEEITDPQAIVAIGEKVKSVARAVLRPPTILGSPKVTTTMDSAEVTWTTDREAGSVVRVVPDADYNSSSDDPYTIVQGDPNEKESKHAVTVIGLEAGTTYHFQVESSDSLGLLGRSADDTFKTKTIAPTISKINVSRVQEHSVVVSWQTQGVLSRGLVEFTNMRTKVKRSSGNPVYATSQSITLSELEFGTRYSAVIRASNDAGDEAVSAPFQFVTVRDVVAPAIFKVKNESTLFPGEDTKIQTILAWETDEPAYCQVHYSQGLARGAGDEGDSLPKETDPVTTHTQVVVGFASATVYQYWMTCTDESDNDSRSEDFVLITPIKEKSIIDVILENFQGTFGWVNKIGK